MRIGMSAAMHTPVGHCHTSKPGLLVALAYLVQTGAPRCMFLLLGSPKEHQAAVRLDARSDFFSSSSGALSALCSEHKHVCDPVHAHVHTPTCTPLRFSMHAYAARARVRRCPSASSLPACSLCRAWKSSAARTWTVPWPGWHPSCAPCAARCRRSTPRAASLPPQPPLRTHPARSKPPHPPLLMPLLMLRPALLAVRAVPQGRLWPAQPLTLRRALRPRKDVNWGQPQAA